MIIKRVHHSKYLGLILDESLSFKEHIKNLTKQLNKLGHSYNIIRYRVTNNKNYNIYISHTHTQRFFIGLNCMEVHVIHI